MSPDDLTTLRLHGLGVSTPSTLIVGHAHLLLVFALPFSLLLVLAWKRPFHGPEFDEAVTFHAKNLGCRSFAGHTISETSFGSTIGFQDSVLQIS